MKREDYPFTKGDAACWADKTVIILMNANEVVLEKSLLPVLGLPEPLCCIVRGLGMSKVRRQVRHWTWRWRDAQLFVAHFDSRQKLRRVLHGFMLHNTFMCNPPDTCCVMGEVQTFHWARKWTRRKIDVPEVLSPFR